MTTKKNNKKKQEYFSNEAFLQSLKVYRETEDEVERRKASRILLDGIILLVKRLAHRPNFSGYSYIDDMKSEAVAVCWKALDKFDYKTKDNPHAYFTTTAWNAFLTILNSEKKERENVNNVLRNMCVTSGMFSGEYDSNVENDFNQYMAEYIKENDIQTEIEEKEIIRKLPDFEKKLADDNLVSLFEESE